MLWVLLLGINLSAQGFWKVPEVGWDWATCSGQPFAYFVFGAAVSEVEVRERPLRCLAVCTAWLEPELTKRRTRLLLTD